MNIPPMFIREQVKVCVKRVGWQDDLMNESKCAGKLAYIRESKWV